MECLLGVFVDADAVVVAPAEACDGVDVVLFGGLVVEAEGALCVGLCADAESETGGEVELCLGDAFSGDFFVDGDCFFGVFWGSDAVLVEPACVAVGLCVSLLCGLCVKCEGLVEVLVDVDAELVFVSEEILSVGVACLICCRHFFIATFFFETPVGK